jgi:TrkA domain protein
MTQFGDIEVTDLPGIGVRYDFTTGAGDRLGVLVHQSGARELLIYEHGDPDRARTLPLTDRDLVRLGEVLGLSAPPEG